MHILSAISGVIHDGQDAIDLGQSPADIVFLTSADTEISCLAMAQDTLIDRYGADTVPSVRVANTLQLKHPYSVDVYMENTVQHARIVVARLLGGKSYFSYGVEQLSHICTLHNIPLVLLSGDDTFDADIWALSTVPKAVYHTLWAYFNQGGVQNTQNALIVIGRILGADYAEPMDVVPLLKCGVYGGDDTPALVPSVLVVCYRALVQSGNMAVIDAVCDTAKSQGLHPVCVYVTSLKDPSVAHTLAGIIRRCRPHAILNMTGFALKPLHAQTADLDSLYTPTIAYDLADCPVYQVVLASTTLESYKQSGAGLSPRDVAMYIALPEVDGRIITHAISFKTAPVYNATIQADIVAYTPIQNRIDTLIDGVVRGVRLRIKPNAEKHVVLMFSNYPNRDGRLANGVGLDTPAGALQILNTLEEQGYTVGHTFGCGNDITTALKSHVTNTGDMVKKAYLGKKIGTVLSRAEYDLGFKALSQSIQDSVNSQWGNVESDPYYHPDLDALCLPIHWVGNVALCTQPARGYNIDVEGTYHDADLVPPHGYIATYLYLQLHGDAIVHMGKHGNLEWLPGKSVALSDQCYPSALLGGIPHIYPFIVNDPGEGTQAKRRTHATIIDHMTPPLARAETYGYMKDLERLIDEYYTASVMDERRVKPLQTQIIQLAQKTGIFKDLQYTHGDDIGATLATLDTYLCTLKEMQIRDGLHVFGCSPRGEQLHTLLVALARAPCHGTDTADGGNTPLGEHSLIRALAQDAGFDFDPLVCDFATLHMGEKPSALAYENLGMWRSLGDTVERLEAYALDMVRGTIPPLGKASAFVHTHIKTSIAPLVETCGGLECEAVVRALSGQYVRSGASGAPTRGRLDVLPTGKNFYSVDTRAMPTPSAWHLGWKSATMVINQFVQDHGEYPAHIAVSAWGTANMRTGGDDVCQVLALMGAKPEWDAVTGRVTGFEILPLSILGRPRVDVVLRVSGFFRDAFENLIDLVDSAVRKIAVLDEPYDQNPIKKKYDMDLKKYAHIPDVDILAGTRIFGSAPGAYGAGMQALIDEGHWQTDADLGETYIQWGAYAYGHGAYGIYADTVFRDRLHDTQAVLHNQDNREHDILDSDDYYQFQGGLCVAIRHVSGHNPTLYFNDHSKPYAPEVRTLDMEISRVVRGRASNPKWIAGVMRHGYKGAFEISATVEYLYAFSATTRVVSDHHFDQLYDAYLHDTVVYTFLAKNNPDALLDIIHTFQDAIKRGLWRSPRRNSVHVDLDTMCCRLASSLNTGDFIP